MYYYWITKLIFIIQLLILELKLGCTRHMRISDLPVKDILEDQQKILNGEYYKEYDYRGQESIISKQANLPYLSYLSRKKKPNIVLILTDDQDIELGSLNFMPCTLKRIRDEGAELRHAYVTTPMCCPSRSSLLTGRYVHNHEVFTNNDNCSSLQWQREHEPHTFATYLSNAGYRTGYFGKYLNKYNGSYIPPGWHEWNALIMNSRYYNYTVNVNGKKIKHGFEYNKDYYSDLVANDSIAFLRHSKHNFARKPILLVASFPAPHGPEDSAPQFSDLFFNVTTHHTPAYDYAPNPDKQWILQVTQKMQPIHKQFTNLLMTKRLQTLQSVDAAVEKIYQELKNLGELDNTYMIYTSDHGYHLGQFGLIKGKSFPFEFDVRVPFLIRGPGIEPGLVLDDIVLNIDLAPTFLDIGDVQTPPRMDGRSIKKLFSNKKSGRRSKYKWPDTFLIESSGRRETFESIAGIKAREVRKQARLNMSANYKEDIIKELDLEKTFPKTHVQSEFDSNPKFFDNDKHEEYILDDQDHIDFSRKAYLEHDAIYPNYDLNQQQKYHMQQQNNMKLQKKDQLAIMCSTALTQVDCFLKKKWRCETEEHRCRRHKCVKENIQQQQLDQVIPISQNVWKKCACFTSNGIIYTRIKNNGQRFIFGENNKFIKPYRQEATTAPERDKREIRDENSVSVTLNIENKFLNNDWERDATYYLSDNYDTETLNRLIDNHLNVDDIVAKYHRIRRNTMKKKSIDYVTKIMNNIKEELDHFKLLSTTSRSIRTIKVPENSISNSFLRRKLQSSDSFFSKPTNVFSISSINNSTSITLTNASTIDDTVISIISVTSTTLPTSRIGITTKTPIFNSNLNKKSEWNVNSRIFFKTPHKTQETSSIIKPVSKGSLIENMYKQQKKHPGLYSTKSRLPQKLQHKCFCEPDSYVRNQKETTQEKRRLKEERLRKKERKLKKKAKLEKICLTEKMNCFEHDNNHWRTAPLWNAGPFCFCMNANNNTYSCIRTINATHNFLYCEFTTGLITFYNLRIDPFEQWNRISALNSMEKSYLHDQLQHLKQCKGTYDCTVGIAKETKKNAFIKQQKSMLKRKYSKKFDAVFVPSTLQITSDSELLNLQHHRQNKEWLYSRNKHNRNWKITKRYNKNVTIQRRHQHHL